MSGLGKRTGRAIQKRSKGDKPKLPAFNRFRFSDAARDGLGVAASNAAAMALQGVASFAGAFAAVGVAHRRVADMVGSPSGDALEPDALPATVSAPPAPGIAVPASRFAPAGPAPEGVRAGAVRDYLRARFPGQKPHLAVAALTGIPAGTVRNAMAWNGPSELSGAHMLRLVQVFGPDFLKAVLAPAPDWLGEVAR
jgi:hypothetical protein